MILSGWGRFPRADCRVETAREPADARAAVLAGGEGGLIARGAGRAYGDPALNPRGVLAMGRTDRMLAFDPATGLLEAEAGVMLRDVVATFAPRGWFPPVTPGTQFVTLGGMAACDVHGKNHHGAGSISRHIAWLDLLLADGATVRCAPDADPDLFWSTCGGMGLTGVILRLALKLIPIETGVIRQTTLACPNLDAAMAAFEANRGATYSVAWIDCLASGASLGRSLLYLGEHARAADLPPGADPHPPRPKRPRRVPVDFPGFALNRLSVAAFNALYYARGRPGEALVDLQTYFYPLDALLEWNRIYGAQGFVQHQCVLPLESARDGLRALLTRIAARGAGSFLAVLKLLGEASPGPLSFPMPGYTLALDFPATAANFSLLVELDAVVADHGGGCTSPRTRAPASPPARLSAAGPPARRARPGRSRPPLPLPAIREARPVTVTIQGPVLVLGARSDVGREVARAYAALGLPVILAARDAASLEADTADMAIRGGASVRAVALDVLDVDPRAFFDGLLSDGARRRAPWSASWASWATSAAPRPTPPTPAR